MPTYNEFGQEVETEEERRKRLAEEAAAAYQPDSGTTAAMSGGFGETTAPAGGGFMDAVGNYAQRRFDAATASMFATPEEAANTEVQSTQVKTYGDGSQEEIVKRQIPAAGPVAPAAALQEQPVAQAQPMAAPVAPTAAPAPAQKSPEEIAANAQALRSMMAQQQQQRTVQTAPTQVPEQLPASGAISPAAATAPVAMPTLPQAGPGVQLAGPVVPGALPPATTPTGQAQVGTPAAAPSLSQAGAQAQATPAPAVAAPPAEPAWMTAANEAGNDYNKLLDIATQYPEARSSLKGKMLTALDNERKDIAARKDIEAAAKGDIRAQNRVNQALRPEKGREKDEVTTNDYIKAYLYSRLGLTELAAEAQNKILGKTTKFGQVSMPDGSNWDVERDRSGRIVAAKDNEGTVATESTLAKIRADSRAVSTATPSSATSTRIRDSQGTEWSQVPTAQGMKFYNNKGEQGVPEGRTVPIAVGSDLELAQAREDMQTMARFSTMSAQARLNSYENTNKRRADKGFPLLSLEEMGLRSDGSMLTENVRRPNTTAATTPAVIQSGSPPIESGPAPVIPTPVPVSTTPAATTPAATTPAAITPAATTTTPLVTTAGPGFGGGGGGGAGKGRIPTASQMEEQGKNADAARDISVAATKDLNKANQEFSDSLATNRATATSQSSVIKRLQSSIDQNPEFWGIDTNSGVWRAYVDLNSTNERKAEALNTLARNLNIPANKRAQFDQTMNDYRNLQVNAVTGSGLSASQTNSEGESRRVVGTVGAISDRPAAAKATLEYAKAKIEYTDAKARAWADARRRTPGIDRLAFEANFDATTGEKIFNDANERMNKILGGGAGAAPAAQTTKVINGVTYVYDGKGWKPR